MTQPDTFTIASIDEIGAGFGRVTTVDHRGPYAVAITTAGFRFPLNTPLCACCETPVEHEPCDCFPAVGRMRQFVGCLQDLAA